MPKGSSAAEQCVLLGCCMKCVVAGSGSSDVGMRLDS